MAQRDGEQCLYDRCVLAVIHVGCDGRSALSTCTYGREATLLAVALHGIASAACEYPRALAAVRRMAALWNGSVAMWMGAAASQRWGMHGDTDTTPTILYRPPYLGCRKSSCCRGE